MDSREFEEHSRRINKFLNQRDASPSKSAKLTERIIDELSRAIAQMTLEQNPQEWSQAELRGREYLAQAKEQKKITLFTQCVSDFRAALAGKIEVGRSENVWLHIAMASQDNARLTEELSDIAAGLDAYRDAIERITPESSLEDWVAAKLGFADLNMFAVHQTRDQEHIADITLAIFIIVIWGSDRSAFGKIPAKQCITGTISSRRGVPEVIARNASQIRPRSD